MFTTKKVSNLLRGVLFTTGFLFAFILSLRAFSGLRGISSYTLLILLYTFIVSGLAYSIVYLRKC
jgi:hypothetical protein